MKKEWLTARELAEMRLPGLAGTVQMVNARAKRENWTCRKRQGRGGGREYAITSLPFVAREAILERDAHRKPSIKKSDPAELWRWYDSRPNTIKNEAIRRVYIVNYFLNLLSGGASKKEAYTATSAASGDSPETIRRWMKSLKGAHRSDWLPTLAPRHMGGGAAAEISVEAWDYFKADYLRPEAPAAEAVYRRMTDAGREREWVIPSSATFRRKIAREIPRPLLILARKGAEALERTYPAQERDKSRMRALEAVNADGHKFDVFVQWPDGEIARPLLLAWQDVYSGKSLSWRVDRTENAGLIRLAFGDLVEQYGIPENAYLDNGRGFASKWLTGGMASRYRFKVKEEDPVGILTQMGVAVHWVTPYHGQAKPIERMFRDFCEDVSKHPAFAGAYTGNNPMAKPENYRSKAIPLDDFLAVLKQEIIRHNAREGRRTQVCGGVRSFDQVFAESYATSPIRKGTAEQRRLWLLAAEGVLASRVDGSLNFLGNRYWGKELARYAGEKLVARFDPQNLQSSVSAYTLAGDFLCYAECVMAVGFNDVDSARDHMRAKRGFVKAVKAQRDAEIRMSVAKAAGMLPAPEETEEPAARIIAPVFRRVEDVYDQEEVDGALAKTARVLKLRAEAAG